METLVQNIQLLYVSLIRTQYCTADNVFPAPCSAQNTSKPAG